MGNFNEDDDLIDEQEAEGGEPAEGEPARAGGSNRNFIIAISILGAIFLLGVIGLVAALFLLRPGQRDDIRAANDAIATQNAQIAATATQAAADAGIAAQLLTPSVTPTATQTQIPPTPTHTQVVAQFTPTASPTATLDPSSNQAKTATVAALFTQAAEARITRTVTATGQTGGLATSTSLPKTGFAEDVGLPGLFGLSLVLIAVIVLVRRLRLSTSS